MRMKHQCVRVCRLIYSPQYVFYMSSGVVILWIFFVKSDSHLQGYKRRNETNNIDSLKTKFVFLFRTMTGQKLNYCV